MIALEKEIALNYFEYFVELSLKEMRKHWWRKEVREWKKKYK